MYSMVLCYLRVFVRFADLPNNANVGAGAIYPYPSRHLKYFLPFTVPLCFPFASSNSTPTNILSAGLPSNGPTYRT